MTPPRTIEEILADQKALQTEGAQVALAAAAADLQTTALTDIVTRCEQYLGLVPEAARTPLRNFVTVARHAQQAIPALIPAAPSTGLPAGPQPSV